MTLRSFIFVLAISAVPATAQSELFECSVRLIASVRGRPSVLAFDPGGAAVALGTAEGQVQLIDLRSGAARPRVVAEHPRAVLGLAFARDGSLLVSASELSIIVTFLDVNAEPILIRPRFRLRSVAVAPEKDLIAAGAADGSVILWDVHSRQEVFRVQSHDRRPIRTVRFAHAGASLLTVSGDGNICEWDTKTRSLLREVRAEGNTILSATIADRANIIAIGTEVSGMNQAALPSGGSGTGSLGRGGGAKLTSEL